MSSRSTATSPLPHTAWERLLSAVPAAIDEAGRRGAHVAVVFGESSRYESLTYRQKVRRRTILPPALRRITRHVEGASVTSYRGDQQQICTLDEFSAAGARIAAASASRWLEGERRRAGSLSAPPSPAHSAIVEPLPESAMTPAVLELVRQSAEGCLGMSPDVRTVTVEVTHRVRRIHVASSSGSSGSRVHRRMTVRTECGLADGRVIRAVAGALPAPLLWDVRALVADVRQRLAARRSGPLPYPASVVLSSGWCAGTWLHETVGHLLEGDHVSRDGHPFGRAGESVAPSFVSISDDPSYPDGRVAMSLDDEGTPTSKTTMIRCGRIERRLHSRSTAAATGETASGSGRRQDFRWLPLPRMTNLVLENGGLSCSSILRGVQSGILVRDVSVASVDGRTGDFRFEMVLAHAIERGEIGEPVTGLVLSGNARSALSGIRAVGDDLQVDPARGVCVKRGQRVEVGLGSPTLLVEGLKVAPAS